MSFTPTPIVRGRYQNSVRQALQEILAHYLALEHSALFAKWRRGGLISVCFTHPETAPVEKLPCPRVLVEEPVDRTTPTFLSSGQIQHLGEWHVLEVELRVCTDQGTGGTLTATDVSTAIELVMADHSGDLQQIGLLLQEKTTDPGAVNPATGLFEKVVRLSFELQVLGEAIRTLELELGRWSFTATGQGRFAPGLTLELPHKLRLVLLTGTGTNPTAVTVAALNEDGDPRRLRGTIPATRSGGTEIALLDEDPADKYSQVTGITVTPGSGLAGEAFKVTNIPEELGG